MNRIKNLISIRVASMLLFLLSTFTAWAEVGDQFIVDGLKYTITSESPDYTVELARCITSSLPSTSLIIPASVSYEENDYAVTSIGLRACYDCTTLTSIIVPNSVTYIGQQAFQNCIGITSIVIPNSVTELGRRAFYKCANLISITVPCTVSTIGNLAFEKCTGLTSVVIGSGVTTIASDAFKGCEAVTDVYCYADPSKLEWDHQGHSNFSRYMTNFHVFDTSEWTGFDGPGLVFVGDLKVDLVADLDACIITLEAAKGEPCIFKREFQGDISSTICLPFSITPSEGIGTFYEFTGVNDNRTEATMTQAQTPLVANTPYLFKPAADGELTFEGTIDVSEVVAGKVSDDSGNWTFTGTYAERRWDAENNTDELGRIYGFASGQGYGNTEASTEAGVFIRLNSGGIKPFRAYLEYNETQARARSRGAAEELPERMSVRLIGNDGQTTGISTLDIQISGEWYDLSGRKLMNKPTRNEVYIKNGRKIVNRK